jgi:Zn finger protein HypA/HybF involved in hydrogenase expression
MRKSMRISSSKEEKDIEFKPIKYECLLCNNVVYSEYSGHYCQCSCGKLAVDQTEYYTRILGTPTKYKEVIDDES